MFDARFIPLHFTTDDGLTLYGREYGGPTAGRPPVVCLAGLSRNSRDFHQLASALAAENRRVIVLDYRGRGLSDWDPNPANYNIGREAQDVVLALRTLGIERAIFIGTSRGGLILHVLPVVAPGLIGASVLNDVGPVLETDGLRAIRDYLSARPEPKDFAQAARALRATHGDAFPILDDGGWADMAEAIFRDIGGRIVPDHDPALVEPLRATDFSQKLPDLWQQFEALGATPMMVIRGENSRLLSQATAEEMVRRHGAGAELVIAEGQGHAPVLHVGTLRSAIVGFIGRH